MTTRFRHTINIEDMGKFTLPVRDATKFVYLRRMPRDIQNGVPGEAGSCAWAQCINRLSNEFDHPVYAVEVTYGRVIIVDSIDGNANPDGCVRYEHKEANDVKLFDKLGKEGILKSGQVDKIIALMPPSIKVGKPGKPRDRTVVRESRGTMGSKGSVARKKESMKAHG